MLPAPNAATGFALNTNNRMAVRHRPKEGLKEGMMADGNDQTQIRNAEVRRGSTS